MREKLLIHSENVKKDENGNYYHDDAYVILVRGAKHIKLGTIKTKPWWRPAGLMTDEEFTQVMELLSKSS